MDENILDLNVEESGDGLDGRLLTLDDLDVETLAEQLNLEEDDLAVELPETTQEPTQEAASQTPSRTPQQQAADQQAPQQSEQGQAPQQTAAEINWDYNGKNYKASPQQLMEWRANGLRLDDYTRRNQEMKSWYNDVRNQLLSVQAFDEWLNAFPEKKAQIMEIMFGSEFVGQPQQPQQGQPQQSLGVDQLIQQQQQGQQLQQVGSPQDAELRAQAQRQYLQNWFQMKMVEEQHNMQLLRQHIVDFQQRNQMQLNRDQVDMLLGYAKRYQLNDLDSAYKIWQADYYNEQSQLAAQHQQQLAQQRQQPPQQPQAAPAAPVAPQPTPHVVSGNRPSQRGVKASAPQNSTNRKPRSMEEAHRMALREFEALNS